MSYEITGTIKIIKDEQVFDSGFKKRELVLTVNDGKYEQEVLLELIKDRCDMLDNHSVGDVITAKFDIKGREYNDRHFVNLQAWALLKEGEDSSTQTSTANVGEENQDNYDDSDDLPF